MMRFLYIMRHAAAESSKMVVDDFSRPLSYQGRKEIESVSQQIVGLLDEVSYVLCSRSVRTQQTYEGIREILPVHHTVRFLESLYLASHTQILENLHEIEESPAAVLVIGHNPGVSQLLADVCIAQGQIYPGTMAPASIAGYENTTDTWDHLTPAALKWSSLFTASGTAIRNTLTSTS